MEIPKMETILEQLPKFDPGSLPRFDPTALPVLDPEELPAMVRDED